MRPVNRDLTPIFPPIFPIVFAALLALVTAPAAGQTARLNDTGQSLCFDGSAMVACSAANTSDAAAYPRQDGRFGRDAQATAGVLTKIGGGAAGFDFTRICWNGKPEGDAQCTGVLEPNLTGAPRANPATDWACTRDNVTGFTWSLQSQSATWNKINDDPNFPNAGHNAANRCGFSTGWGLPNRHQLLSIVHYGKASGPAIDLDYFPDTDPSTIGTSYWSSDEYAPDAAAYAWDVNFRYGSTNAYDRGTSSQVRLVRGGQ